MLSHPCKAIDLPPLLLSHVQSQPQASTNSSPGIDPDLALGHDINLRHIRTRLQSLRLTSFSHLKRACNIQCLCSPEPHLMTQVHKLDIIVVFSNMIGAITPIQLIVYISAALGTLWLQCVNPCCEFCMSSSNSCSDA